MDYLTVVDPIAQAQHVKELDPHSVYAQLQTITDPRKKRGVRYSVALILTLVVVAKLAGETTLSGTAQWVRLRGDWLAEQLQLSRTTFPCAATYSNVLRQVDAEEVTVLIRQCLTRRSSPKQQEGGTTVGALATRRQLTQQVALDGKTLRGTRDRWQEKPTALHLLAMYEVGTGLVLVQQPVEQCKENEIVVAPKLSSRETVSGRVITADAMHTQRAFCRLLLALGGHYILIAKDNQPTLHQDIALFFEDPQADRTQWQSTTTCEKGHGRLERRTMTTSTELSDYFHQEWEGIAQVFHLQRTITVIKEGIPRIHDVYGFTSLPPAQADPAKLSHFVRSHWSIENRLHWRRDATLKEDQSLVRVPGAPAVLAALNNAVLALMDSLGVTNVRSQMRTFAAQPHLALHLLLSGR